MEGMATNRFNAVSLSWSSLNRRIPKGVWVSQDISRGGLFGDLPVNIGG
jgi:hypothetical protein